MHTEINMSQEGVFKESGVREPELTQSEAELVRSIFNKAQDFIRRFGEPSTWGKELPKEVIYLDVPDSQDLRGHHRVLIWGNSESDEVAIFYNQKYVDRVYLNTQLHLTRNRVVTFNANIEEWHGDSPIFNPPWSPTPEMEKVMGSRFHPKEHEHGDLDLAEIDRLLTEGKVIGKPKKDRIVEAAVKNLEEVEHERVFGKPQEAAQKAKDLWSEEAILTDLKRIKSLPQEEQKEVEEKLALAYVDAAFKELSAINSLAQDTADSETRQRLLDEARESIRREGRFHILAKQLAKTVSGEEIDWSKVKLREFGRMYERHETPEYWQLAKLIYSKVVALSERDSDLGTQAAATMELARVSEKLGEDNAAIDSLYNSAHKLNWDSRRDRNYNRQVTIEGNILRRNLKRRALGAAFGSMKHISWIVIHDPRQAIVLGKKIVGS